MTTNETSALRANVLYRARESQPETREPFEPKKVPFSIWFLGFAGNCCIAVGLLAMGGGFVMMYEHGIAAGGGNVVLAGLTAIGAGAFNVACYHVGKAVLDMRDMMRHRGQ